MNNTGIEAAKQAAATLGGRVALPAMGKRADFWDVDNELGSEAVRLRIEKAQPPVTGDTGAKAEKNEPDTSPVDESGPKAPGEFESDEAFIQRLAALPPLYYDREREDAAKALRVRTATLDKLVYAARKEEKTESAIVFDPVEPWPEAVSPATLLTEVSDTVKRFIVCHKETADAVALWAAMTWFMDVVQVAPLAVITAPEKRCGKSQLLFLLGRLVARPLTASNISPAALFRSIDAWKPTLLVDEADAFMRENEELRGLLNCGHTRDSAYILRVVGEDFAPQSNPEQSEKIQQIRIRQRMAGFSLAAAGPEKSPGGSIP